MKKIFLSSASKDHVHARGLYSYLSSKNEKIWCNSIDKPLPGEDYKDHIMEEIDNSVGSVLLVSQAYLNSEFITTLELDAIFEKKKSSKDYFILPLLLEKDVDFTNYPDIDYRKMHFCNSNSTALNSLEQAQYDVVCGVLHEQIKLYKPAFKSSITKQEAITSKMFEEFLTSSLEKNASPKKSPSEKTNLQNKKAVQTGKLNNYQRDRERILNKQVERATHYMDVLERSTRTLKKFDDKLRSSKRIKFQDSDLNSTRKIKNLSILVREQNRTQREMFELLEYTERTTKNYKEVVSRIHLLSGKRQKGFESDLFDEKFIDRFSSRLIVFEKRIEFIMKSLNKYGGNTKFARQCYGLFDFSESGANEISKNTNLNFYKCGYYKFHHVTNKVLGRK